MKNSVKVRIICLIVALVMLSGAIAYAAVMGSPYVVLRDAVLDALTERNVTAEGSLRLYLNGELMEFQQIQYVVGDDAWRETIFDADGNPTSFSFGTNYLRLNLAHEDIDGMRWYSAHVSPDMMWGGRSPGIEIFTLEDRNSPQMRFGVLVLDALVGDLRNNITMSSSGGVRTLRGTLSEHQVPELVRAGIDLLLASTASSQIWREQSIQGNQIITESITFHGDTVTITTFAETFREMTPEEARSWYEGTFWDDIFHYSYGQLREDRLTHEANRYGVSWHAVEWVGGAAQERPHILTSFREVTGTQTLPATSQTFENRDMNPLDMPPSGITLNNITGEARVDADGNLLDVEIAAKVTIEDMFGGRHVVNVYFEMSFTDIGTSRPTSPIAGAEQVLTYNYLSTRFGTAHFNRWSTVFFTLNADGSINTDSLTMQRPGGTAPRQWLSSSFVHTEVMIAEAPIVIESESSRVSVELDTGEAYPVPDEAGETGDAPEYVPVNESYGADEASSTEED